MSLTDYQKHQLSQLKTIKNTLLKKFFIKCIHKFANLQYNIINQKYKVPIYASTPHHNIDAYRKTDFLDCISDFKSYFDQTLNHRFREDSDMQRTSVAFYSIAKGNAIVKYDKINFFQKYVLKKSNDSMCFAVKQKFLNKARKCQSKLVCFNDSLVTTDICRIEFKKILEDRFPSKSQFEK